MRKHLSGHSRSELSSGQDAYRGHLLRDLVSGRPAEPLLAELGWQPAGPVVVLVAVLDGVVTDRRAEQERFAAVWRAAVERHGSDLPCADLATEVVVLLPDGDPAKELVHRVVATVAGELADPVSFTCGVSRTAAHVTGLAAAYDQARRAVEIGRQVHGGGTTCFFEDLGVDRLIALVPDGSELETFARDVLGPLAGDDDESEGLRETLRALIECNFNVAEAARAQFFHYNTMRYRLAKIERLVGPVSSDARVRLDVAVALRVLG